MTPDDECGCGHTYDEHHAGRGRPCIAIVEVHERTRYCPCVAFHEVRRGVTV